MVDDKLAELENALAQALNPAPTPPPAAEPEPAPVSSAEAAPPSRTHRWRAVDQADEEEGTLVLVAAPLARRIPLWGWATLAGVLAVLFFAILYGPAWETNHAASLLADENEETVREAMRQLATDPSSRAVETLSSLAASPKAPERARLNAVDALSLSQSPKADQALLDLATAADVADPIRERANLARQQRERREPPPAAP